MPKIALLNGPNLNLIGYREPEVYGYETLADITANMQALATQHDIELSTLQSNAEHKLVDAIHSAKMHGVDFIIINPGAFTHTSIALRDAFSGTQIPFIEIHLSNVHAREEFRHHSYLSGIANGVIVGLGAVGYELAFKAAISKIKKQ